MADVKKVLAIDVDDKGFQKFLAEYKKWEQSLNRTPQAWAKTTQQMAKAAQQMQAAAQALHGVSVKINSEHARIAEHAKKTDHHWKESLKHIKEVAHRVKEISKSLLGWVGFGGLFGSLAGLGGFMSFLRMGERATEGRHVALGRGSTTGGETAFQRVFSSVLDQPSAMLEGVARAKTSYSAPERVALASLGITNLSGTTDQVAARATAAFMRRTRGMSEGQITPMIEAGQWGLLGLTSSAALRAREYDPSTLLGKFEKQRKTADIPKSVSKVWEDFMHKLEESSDRIQTTLINKFVEWAPVLTEIAQIFTDMLDNALKGDTFGNVLKFVREKLEEFKTWLEGGGVQRALERFQEIVTRVADWIDQRVFGKYPAASAPGIGGVSWSGGQPVPPPSWSMPGSAAYEARRVHESLYGGGPNARWYKRGALQGIGGDYVQPPAYNPQGMRQHGGSVGAGQTVTVGEKGPEQIKFNRSGTVIPAGFTEALVTGESGGRYGIVNRTSGALGKYQVMPANVRSWTRMAGLGEMTPAQFLASPQAQDAVFIDQMTRNFQKYGTIEDAASIWFTGRPYARAVREGARDINMSVQQYVANIKARMEGKTVGGMSTRLAAQSQAHTPFGADRNVAGAAATSGTGGSYGMTPYENFVDQLVRGMSARAGMNITVEPSPGAHVILGAHMSGPGRRLVG